MSRCDKTNEIFHKYVFKSVRNRVLQQLMILFYVYMYNQKSEGWKILATRYRKEVPGDTKRVHNLISRLEYLKPEDVMQVIGCSKRTAIEYIQALHFIASVRAAGMDETLANFGANAHKLIE